jgi:L-alanine-DL-glutamate epimerase-like enolase superfamily enzyme
LMEYPKIIGVEAIPIEIRGERAFAISEGQTRTHKSVIIRIITDEPNIDGIAEIVCAPPGKPEEIQHEICGALKAIADSALAGISAENTQTAQGIINERIKGKVWTKGGLNVALNDLRAKALGVSCMSMLGVHGEDAKVPVIGTVIGIMHPDQMAERAIELRDRGFGTLKIKIGEDVSSDFERVRCVREAVGDSVKIRVDANDHYSPEEAIKLINKIEHLNVEHVEQPISRYDILGMREIRESVHVPLMTDDMVSTPFDAMNVIRLDAADRVKVKVTKHGLDGAIQIISMLSSAGKKAVLGHVFETGLAAVAEAHLAMLFPDIVGPHEIGSMEPLGVADKLLRENPYCNQGYITIPEGVGLGVTVDWEQVENYKVSLSF